MSVEVFRLTVEFELEGDLDKVVGTVFNRVDHFDGAVHVYLEHATKFVPEVKRYDDDGSE